MEPNSSFNLQVRYELPPLEWDANGFQGNPKKQQLFRSRGKKNFVGCGEKKWQSEHKMQHKSKVS